MPNTSKSKAEKKYAELQKKDKETIQTVQSASQKRLEKSAKLRELRLTMEARDAAEKLELQKQAQTDGVVKKPRVRRGA
jgi:hypothetical protein